MKEQERGNVTDAMKNEWRMQALQLAVSARRCSSDKPLDSQEVLKVAKEWSDFVITGEIGAGQV